MEDVLFHLTKIDIETALAYNVIEVKNGIKRVFKNIQIDSRLIKKNSIFVAIKGDNLDGHSFIKNSVKNGVSAVISEKTLSSSDEKFLVQNKIYHITVKDSLKALWQLAFYNKNKSKARIIGITGSNGKTTTKDFLTAILTRNFKTISSSGSFNNHIGVPLTLMKISHDTEYAVIEMGMNHSGEIKKLGGIVRPDIALVTNVAGSHIEFFNSMKGIASAKAEIFYELKKNGYGVVNRDSSYFSYLKKRCRRRMVSFGVHGNSTYQLKNLTDKKTGYSFSIRNKGKNLGFNIDLPGKHNTYNVLAAIAVCMEEGMSYRKIKQGLKIIKLPKMRMNITKTKKGIVIVNDAYNANPFSTEKAIETLTEIKCSGKRIMVFADMLELGDKSEFYHKKAGIQAAKKGIDLFLCTGNHTKKSAYSFNRYATNGNKAFFFTKKNSLVKKINGVLSKGDMILLKGSRGMKLEEILNDIRTIGRK